MKYPFQIIAATLSLFISLSTTAQTKKYDAFMAEKYSEDGPGGAFLVAKEGKIIYQNAIGKASLELDIDNNVNSVFKIGSVTKQFTAVSILMLQERGLLSVNDSLKKFIPDYPTHGYNITVHHLLNHTSGIANYTNSSGWLKSIRQDYTTSELIDTFKHENMDFAPGERWSYCNSGYYLLGVIIEKASGITYQDFIQKNIFDKLKMKHSYFEPGNKIIENFVQGYSPNGPKSFVNKMYMGTGQVYAAGEILSTVGDMFLWQNALTNNTLISAETTQKLYTNYTLNNGEHTDYGYGFMLGELQGSPTYEHGGGIFGFVCNGIYMPNEKIYVIGLTNRDGTGPTLATQKMAALAMKNPLEHPAPISLTETEMNEYMGVFEFEDGTTRTITLKDNQLFSQRSGQGLIKIFPYQKDGFFFEEGYGKLQFERNNLNQIGAVTNTEGSTNERAKKTDRIPEVKTEIKLDAAALKRFEGKYELDPNFILTVRAENNQLFAQATGQPEFEIFAKTETRFFLKVVDAEIEFFENENKEIAYCILFQGGRELKGDKK